MNDPRPNILGVRDISILYGESSRPAVANVSFELGEGETLGIIGQSGSGKTTLIRGIAGLNGSRARVLGGTIEFAGQTIVSPSVDRTAAIRGRRVGMIFQNATASLNPVITVGRQLDEVLKRHTSLGRRERRLRALEMFVELGFNDPERVYRSFAHELSGGMCQRVAIAIAVAPEPDLVIADEPTSALDVTTQKSVIQMLTRMTVDQGRSLLFVTHDILLAAEFCDRLIIMKDSQIVEANATAQLLANPQEEYTRELFFAVPGWTPSAAQIETNEEDQPQKGRVGSAD